LNQGDIILAVTHDEHGAVTDDSTGHLAHWYFRDDHVLFPLCGTRASLLPIFSPEHRKEGVTCRRCRTHGADDLRDYLHELARSEAAIAALRARIDYYESVLNAKGNDEHA
jgi:hypothetical protein